MAACVNVVVGVTSLYRWEGRIEEASEVLLIIKTTMDRLDVLTAAVSEAHPYSVPELIALPVIAGHPPYLSWLTGAVS